jgi:hypothetical protein
MLNSSKQWWQTLVSGGGWDGWNVATLCYYEELSQVLSEGGEHRNNARVSLRGFEAIQAIYQSVLVKERVHPPIPDGADPLAEFMKETMQED